MALVCRMCSRVNPEEAYYCYYDGVALAGRTATEGPIDVGSQPFPSPFVFPSGIFCNNFDQLAMACQQNWKEAVASLKEGFFGAFFGAIGRLDLAAAAKDAAEFPDKNRGLDQLLGALPTKSLDPPQLRIEPTEINLGQLKFGVDGGFDLDLRNQGMRLAVGTVTSNVPWLALKGHASQSFELLDGKTLPVQVVGNSLRARLKSQEGKLTIESNGGNFTVNVAIEVPPIPFGEGVLVGAMSPRQIAERSRANPNAVVPLFASGAVARWFESNGLVYPVQGPTAPGTAGVQQFFEALGLAKPPKVDFAEKTITVEGKPGETFESPLTVSTQDKKLVYAYATADHPWIDGSVIKPAGRTCTIQLKITVPPQPGETVDAKVTIHANGGQKFTVPVTVNVRGVKQPMAQFVPVDMAIETMEMKPAKKKRPESTGQFVLVPDEPNFELGPTPAFEPVPFDFEPAPSGAATFQPVTFDADSPMDRFRANQPRTLLHFVPALLLVMVLSGVIVHDYFAATVEDDVEPRARIAVRLDYPMTKGEKGVGQSLMVGVQDASDRSDGKRLTYSELGQTNSVVLSIDGKDRVFGKPQHGKLDEKVMTYSDRSTVAKWSFHDGNVAVTQTVQLVGGEPIEVEGGTYKRFYDTCLIRYKVVNRDNRPHAVGLRFLLDTCIGKNDVPLFALPGRPGLVRTILDMRGDDVPDYIEALERPNLNDPGVIAHLNLRLGEKFEFPSRVCLTNWPEGLASRREVFEVPTQIDEPAKTPIKPPAKGKTPPKTAPQPAPPARRGEDVIRDSAIAIYWKTEPLAPGESREFGFTYGLGNVSGLADLTILNPGPIVQGARFSLVALVGDPQKAGNAATIRLPEGLSLVEGSPATQPLLPPKDDADRLQPRPATWIIQAYAAGRYVVTVTTDGASTSRVVVVRKTSVF